MNSKLKLLLLAAGVLALIIAGTRIATVISRHGKVRMNIVIAPSDSAVTLDGKKSKAGTLYVKPGLHTIQANRQYFEPDRQAFTAELGKPQTIYLLPEAFSSQAIQWLKDHREEQLQRESIVGAIDDQKRSVLAAKNPIINKLPVSNERYSVNYSVNSDDTLTYTITTYAILNRPNQYAQYQVDTEQYKAEALSFLQANGVNIKTAKITYGP